MSIPLAFVPIQSTSPAQVAAAYGRATAGAHDFISPTAVLTNMLRRITGDEPLLIAFDHLGPAGWVGLVRYGAGPSTWESTTFLAPSLRGTGAFEEARCIQAHLVDDLVSEHGDGVRVLTSIAQTNARSVAATRRYAAQHDWPTGGLVDEPHKNRTSFVVEWPLPVSHACFLPAVAEVVA